MTAITKALHTKRVVYQIAMLLIASNPSNAKCTPRVLFTKVLGVLGNDRSVDDELNNELTSACAKALTNSASK